MVLRWCGVWLHTIFFLLTCFTLCLYRYCFVCFVLLWWVGLLCGFLVCFSALL
jgi:hypothetical protein